MIYWFKWFWLWSRHIASGLWDFTITTVTFTHHTEKKREPKWLSWRVILKIGSLLWRRAQKWSSKESWVTDNQILGEPFWLSFFSQCKDFYTIDHSTKYWSIFGIFHKNITSNNGGVLVLTHSWLKIKITSSGISLKGFRSQ